MHTAALEVLVVEDAADVALQLTTALSDRGHNPTVLDDGGRVFAELEAHAFDLLICEAHMRGSDGMIILRRVKEERPELPVIVISRGGSIPEAVDALRHHATNYLAEPFTTDELVGAVGEVERELSRHGRKRSGDGPTGAIIGETPVIAELRQLVRRVAATDGPVLITGETGTGKELIARTLHELGARRSEPFVAVNCAAFPDTLLEAELFGHERGAFTGAVHRREGRFRAANRGTLFLDEVGDMALGVQAKLLRVLEDGSFQPLGSDTTITADVRVVSATNADLRTDDSHRFRDDLYYRLKLFHVHVPPLRDRMDDLPLLVQHFLRMLCPFEQPRIAPDAWAALTHHDYPGNVRELRHAIRHAVAMSPGADIGLEHLPDEIRGHIEASSPSKRGIQPLVAAEREFERGYLLRTLDETDWNRTRAAELLGISRKTLWKKLRELGIDQTTDQVDDG